MKLLFQIKLFMASDSDVTCEQYIYKGRLHKKQACER